MRVILVTSPLVIALVIWGCSQSARERFAHFFFEVPTETEAISPPAEAAAPPATPESDAAPPPAVRFASLHAPFRDRDCVGCHDASQRMQVRANYAESCKDCHGGYFTEAVGHSPVTDGDCALCHLPHQSVHPALLRQPVYETCVDCHEPPAELSQPAHAGTGVENCVRCHDAHFGQPPLLKKQRDASWINMLMQPPPGIGPRWAGMADK